MNFDAFVNRCGTASIKWDTIENAYSRHNPTGVIPMTIADMDFPCAPEIVDAVCEKARFPIYGYTVKTPTYRNAPAGWLKKRFDLDVAADELLFGTGVLPFMAAAVQLLTEPGDGVIIQTPVYSPFYRIIRGNGRRVVENPLVESRENGELQYRIDFQQLERLAEAPGNKLMILCNPHNPVGRVWTEEELVQIGEICGRQNVFLFSDEIHQDIVISPHRFTPFLKACPELGDRAISSASASKSFNIAGLDAAYAVVRSRELRRGLVRVMDRNAQNTIAYLSQAALISAYEQCEYYVDEVNAYLQGNLNLLKNFVGKHLPAIRLSDHQGTYLLWMDMTGCGLLKEEIVPFIREHAMVELEGGEEFGSQYKGYVRMNFACQRELLETVLYRFKKTGIFDGRDRS